MKRNSLRTKGNSTLIATIFVTVLALSFASCNQPAAFKQTTSELDSKSDVLISEQEVLDAQKIWSEGVVRIGQTYLENGDYETELVNFVDDVYGFNLGVVLFKPTLASVKQFRTSKEGALSYFIGGNANYPEDHGFAINPWSAVRWENIGIKIVGNMAIAMGNYYFTPALGGDDVKVEYSFAYTKDDKGKLRIILHDSHLPYTPEEKH